jgi:hypothetical protein
MHELNQQGKGDKDRTKKTNEFKKNYEEIQWPHFIAGAKVRGKKTTKKY